MRVNNLRSSLVVALLIMSGCAVSPVKQYIPLHIDDNIITSEIKVRYAESQDLVQSRISVETLYGVVLLTGVTNHPQQKITAQLLAEQVNGVKAVHNQILIQSHSDKKKTTSSAGMHHAVEL